jgi:hypothetical protein
MVLLLIKERPDHSVGNQQPQAKVGGLTIQNESPDKGKRPVITAQS